MCSTGTSSLFVHHRSGWSDNKAGSFGLAAIYRLLVIGEYVSRARKQLHTGEAGFDCNFLLASKEMACIRFQLLLKGEDPFSFLGFWRTTAESLRNAARASGRDDERISRIPVSRRKNTLSLNIHITRRERTELMVENDEWRGALRNGKLKFLGRLPSFFSFTAGWGVREPAWIARALGSSSFAQRVWFRVPMKVLAVSRNEKMLSHLLIWNETFVSRKITWCSS